MKSKEKVLNECILNELRISGNNQNSKECALKAMDTHARNCMIEFMYWYDKKYCKSPEGAAEVVDGFLSSEYFKDLQK